MKLKYNKVLIIVSFAVMLFGIIFFSTGTIISTAGKNKEKRCTYKLTATVYENIRSSDKDSNAVYPVYVYYYKGKRYKVKSRSGSYPPQFSVGEEVDMYINPDHPDDYYVPADTTTKTIALVFRIVGGVIAVLGLLVPMAIAAALGRKQLSVSDETVSGSRRKNEDTSRDESYTDDDYISTVEEYNRYDSEDSKYDM